MDAQDPDFGTRLASLISPLPSTLPSLIDAYHQFLREVREAMSCLDSLDPAKAEEDFSRWITSQTPPLRRFIGAGVLSRCTSTRASGHDTFWSDTLISVDPSPLLTCEYAIGFVARYVSKYINGLRVSRSKYFGILCDKIVLELSDRSKERHLVCPFLVNLPVWAPRGLKSSSSKFTDCAIAGILHPEAEVRDRRPGL